ncbi:retron Ec67 family RNA-directed DNA polymerase/endonuclease [Exiguobacterium sp. s142]|uniref:retron Ec67 family RNA-directed DNA polymerase/endonuclease n=1 Tax=Exiguobacterium sp. s142 TaxID=2751222 RepID=UPI001BEB54D4|nr:retron Ec67 family RNA-directed DNA polymerase/endonuclease [Exiguobacterium sp. s142]
MTNFKDIKTRNELAEFIGIPIRHLTNVLYKINVDNMYSSFKIPKKSGGERVIQSPNKDLKNIQVKIAQSLDVHITKQQKYDNNISHAFKKNKGIITNSKVHRNKRIVVNMDLENFFESIHFGRVRGYFNKNDMFKLPIEVATILAQLTCYKGSLPQGGSTSPIISNLICEVLDYRILSLAKKYKLKYTRYADDLTFSTNNNEFVNLYSQFSDEISKVILKSGFRINQKKTRLQFWNSRQTVTGLVVNKKINVPREYYKNTRAMANQLYKTGEYVIDGDLGTIGRLEGRFTFIDQLTKYNNSLDDDIKHNRFHLSGREVEYQKFLFYKYFFSNSKPLLITEGKTDVRYLKAALKKHSLEYPELVEKDTNDNFNFKITFLKKTKRMKYFFGIVPDGASALNNVYNFYKGVNLDPNHYEHFMKISENRPTNPVVLLFDNEITKEKPLNKFINHAKINNKKSIIKQNLTLNVIGNLHLLTTPLMDNRLEGDIEDLFKTSELAIVIKGRKFDKTEKLDKSLYYGKDQFSKYVLLNYEEIDFDNFKPLLDKLSDLIRNHSVASK